MFEQRGDSNPSDERGRSPGPIRSLGGMYGICTFCLSVHLSICQCVHLSPCPSHHFPVVRVPNSIRVYITVQSILFCTGLGGKTYPNSYICRSWALRIFYVYTKPQTRILCNLDAALPCFPLYTHHLEVIVYALHVASLRVASRLLCWTRF